MGFYSDGRDFQVYGSLGTHGTSTPCGVIMDKKSGASRDYCTFLVVVLWCYRARDSAQLTGRVCAQQEVF